MTHEVSQAERHGLSDLPTLRLEAMALYERCLKLSDSALLEDFLQQQLLQEPPPVPLFHEIAEDLHQRLQLLRQQHYSLADTVMRTERHDVQQSIRLTESLYRYTLDWANAYNVELARKLYSEYTYKRTNSPIGGTPFL